MSARRTASVYGKNRGVRAWQFEEWRTFNSGGITPCVVFARGFIEHVRVPALKWFRDSGYFLSLHPIRRVSLTTVPTPDDLLSIADQSGVLRQLFIPALLAAKWPGIAFEIPGVSFEVMARHMSGAG